MMRVILVLSAIMTGCSSTDAVSSATLSASFHRLDAYESDVVIVFSGSETGSTMRIARAMADVLGANIVSPEPSTGEVLSHAKLVGFGSGIIGGKNREELLGFARRLPPLPGLKVFVFSTAGAPADLMKGRAYDDYVAGNHAALGEILRQKGCVIIGEFGCPGFNDNSFLKWFGGFNKGRPNEGDEKNAQAFAEGLEKFRKD